MNELVIVVPAVPDTRCRPNFRCSERTRIRWRKEWAKHAVMPIRAARMADEARYPICAAVTVDMTIRWPAGRHTWDRDAIVTAGKFVFDCLEREGILENDRDLRTGEIWQEKAFGQEESELVLRWET